MCIYTLFNEHILNQIASSKTLVRFNMNHTYSDLQDNHKVILEAIHRNISHFHVEVSESLEKCPYELVDKVWPGISDYIKSQSVTIIYDQDFAVELFLCNTQELYDYEKIEMDLVSCIVGTNTTLEKIQPYLDDIRQKFLLAEKI